MAIVKLSALVSDIRGKVGGNVFARNKGGAYVRNYTKPTNPSTLKQQGVRLLFAALASAWRGLTSGQRTSWNEATPNYPFQDKLGQTKYYTGEQLYMKLNSNLNAIGQTLLNVPAVPVEFPTMAPVSASGDISDTEILYELDINGAAVIPAGFNLIVEGTAPISAGISAPQRGLFKQVAVLAAAADTSTNDLYAGYAAVFGAPVANDFIYLRARLVALASGEASTDADISLTFVV